MDESNPTPGWFVVLRGHQADLDQWQHALKRPFDPWLERIPRAEETLWALRSSGFEDADDASQVRGRALPILDRLNGAMAVSARAERVGFGGVGRFGPSGEVSMTIFVEAGNIRLRGMSVVAFAEARDADGNLIPPPPPAPSSSQLWMQAAEWNDEIADLLVYAGRTDNWLDIYKGVEMAERIVGGKHELPKLLGAAAEQVKNMRETANFYRHARGHRPKILTSQEEAATLLRLVVLAVLANTR